MRPVLRVDNPTIFLYWLSWNLKVSNFFNPKGLSRPAQRLVYFPTIASCLHGYPPAALFSPRHKTRQSHLSYPYHTNTTSRISLLIFSAFFLLPARWFEIFFRLSAVHFCFQFRLRYQFPYQQKPHKIPYEYSFENSSRRKGYKKKTDDNFYMTPKVFTPNRRKSKPKNTYVSSELKFNYRIFNQKISHHCTGNFILIKY
jgi:hypothetical protein